MTHGEKLDAVICIVLLALTWIQALPVHLHTPSIDRLDLRQHEVPQSIDAGNWCDWSWS